MKSTEKLRRYLKREFLRGLKYMHLLLGSGRVFKWKGTIHPSYAIPSVSTWPSTWQLAHMDIYICTRAWRSRNWCSDLWIEYVYLRGRNSLLSKLVCLKFTKHQVCTTVNSNYFALDAVKAESPHQIDRAVMRTYNSLKWEFHSMFHMPVNMYYHRFWKEEKAGKVYWCGSIISLVLYALFIVTQCTRKELGPFLWILFWVSCVECIYTLACVNVFVIFQIHCWMYTYST